jgi:hypothetical protein
MKYLKYFENINKLDFSFRELKSLKLLQIPKNIIGNLNCSNNKLTSLEFGPETISGDFKCSDNILTSLEHCPNYVGEMFFCHHNNWTNPIPYDIVQKFSFTINDLYTSEQKEKFRSYKFQRKFLTEYPEKYKDLIQLGYHKKIKDEFDWLFNAADMGVM